VMIRGREDLASVEMHAFLAEKASPRSTGRSRSMGCPARPPAESRSSESGTNSRTDHEYRYLVAGVRTPFGRYGNAVGTVRPDDLAVYVVRALGVCVLSESA